MSMLESKAMRTLPLLLAVPLAFAAAPSFAAGDLASAYAAVRDKAPVVALRDVNACFTRPENERADALGLPKAFCIVRVGTREPSDALTPFEYEGSGLVEGTPVSGLSHHISGGSRRSDGGWDLVVDLFEAKGARPKCGKLSTAFAAIYFSVDAVGKPLAGPVEVRGFMMDLASDCRAQAASVDIDYKPAP